MDKIKDEATIFKSGDSWVIVVPKKKLERRGVKLGDVISYQLNV